MFKALCASLIVTLTLSAPLRAQEDQGVASLVTGVTDSANRLQEAFGAFTTAIGDAKNKDSGMKALDEMLAAARGVNESLNKDSEIWKDLDGLLVDWTQKRDDLNTRSKDNPALLPIAEEWQKKLDRVTELRSSILDQSTDSSILITDIENQKEVIAAYYELDQIDSVLQAMETMNDEFTTMNETMQTILAQTVGVQAQPGVAAQ